MASADLVSPSNDLRVYVAAATELRERAVWALEALLARARVRDWELVASEQSADLVIGHDPWEWLFDSVREPDAERDPLAAAFWWLARVEERMAGSERFDDHGRFRFAGSALERRGDPWAAPVDDIARVLVAGIDPRHCTAPAGESAWSIVPTHDIDLPWRWCRSGVRRALREIRDHLRARRIRRALATGAAVCAIPYWRVRRDDPWCNAHRIRRLEWSLRARSTSYVLIDQHVPDDGPIDVMERGRARYIKRLLEGTARRAGAGAPARAGGSIGLHGSYTTSTSPGRIAQELGQLTRATGAEIVDHRYHYLRHTPHTAWPELAKAGITSDTSLGFAELPGLRAGTASPYRAWDHERDCPLDLVIIPLVLMDASFEPRYVDLAPRSVAGRAVISAAISRVRELGGTSSVLLHNDRLCTIDDGGWTRAYKAMLREVSATGGTCVTAREAAATYRASLPAWRVV